MAVRFLPPAPVRALLAATVLTALLAPTAHAQFRLFSRGNSGDGCSGCQSPCAPLTGFPFQTAPTAPQGAPPQTGTQGTQPETTPSPSTAPSQEANQAFGDQAPSLGGETSGALGGQNVALAPGGYLDNAIVRNFFRIRIDAAFDANRPDRAEFLYGAWQELSFHPHGVQNGGVFFDPNARGPQQLPSYINYQEPSAYFEFTKDYRLSAFIDVPLRFVQFHNIQEDPDTQTHIGNHFFPEPENGKGEVFNNNVGGLSDLQFGFKYAMIADPTRYLTFQFRTYVPTGQASLGLGTGHVSVEPGLLLFQRLSQRWILQGQFSTWVPVGGTAAAGDVVYYGAGLGYDLYRAQNFKITPVFEMLGWTVLNGYESVFTTITPANTGGVIVPTTHGVEQAGGDTIVNAKFGVRTYFSRGRDFYIGYGRALTGDVWYKDIIRAEYRINW